MLAFHRLDSLRWQEIMSAMCLMTTNSIAQVPTYDMNVVACEKEKNGHCVEI